MTRHRFVPARVGPDTCMNEIGGEFWLEDAPSERGTGLPEWIARFGHPVLTSSGRGAISLLLQSVEPRLRTALLPSYICGSVVAPFLVAGYTCQFYDVNSQLAPDIESVQGTGRAGLFLHMGYFGFPTNSGLSDVIRDFRARSTVVVENVTHTLFSEYRRLDARDYAVASVRKWASLPGAGFVASWAGTMRNATAGNEAFLSTRREAMLLKGRYVSGGDMRLKPRYLELFAEAERALDADARPYATDAVSEAVLRGLDVKALRERRRSNFRVLAEGLRDVAGMQPVFRSLPDGVCPMFFPVYVAGRRAEVWQKLIEEDIYCPVHWPMPEQIAGRCSAAVRDIYDSELSIPCDQRYGIEDMERIISVLRAL